MLNVEGAINLFYFISKLNPGIKLSLFYNSGEGEKDKEKSWWAK
jgi:hypothetical protein